MKRPEDCNHSTWDVQRAPRTTPVIVRTVDGVIIGLIEIEHSDDAEPIQIAASAYASIGSASVDGERFTRDEIEEWFA